VNRNTDDTSIFANEYLKRFTHVKRMRPYEIDCGQNILELTRKVEQVARVSQECLSSVSRASTQRSTEEPADSTDGAIRPAGHAKKQMVGIDRLWKKK